MATLLLVAWVALGLAMYRRMPREPQEQEFYSYVDAFYLMTQIITTVGYGDMRAPDDAGLLGMSAYVLIAVMVLSSIVGAVTASIIEKEEKIMKQAMASIQVAYNKPVVAGLLTLDLSKIIPAPKLSEEVGGFLRGLLVWLLFVFSWACFFHFYPGEDKDLAKAFYMAVVTLTTVGFGDQTPATQGGKIFATLWMLMGVAAFANLVAKFSAAFLAQRFTLSELTNESLTQVFSNQHFCKVHEEREQAYRYHEAKGPRHQNHAFEMHVHRNDFIVHMLSTMNLVDEDVLKRLNENFDDLDRDKSGFLNEADVQEISITAPIFTRRSVTHS